MNTLETEINPYPQKESYPQVQHLFQTLNISETDKKEIQSDFYRVANIIYERISKISYDTILKMKLGETNRYCFTITNGIEEDLVNEYFNFIYSHPQGEKIWRILMAYYKPSQKIIDSLNF